MIPDFSKFELFDNISYEKGEFIFYKENKKTIKWANEMFWNTDLGINNLKIWVKFNN